MKNDDKVTQAQLDATIDDLRCDLRDAKNRAFLLESVIDRLFRLRASMSRRLTPRK